MLAAAVVVGRVGGALLVEGSGLELAREPDGDGNLIDTQFCGVAIAITDIV